MSSKSQLTPKEAIAYGLLCVAVGIAIALVPLGIVPSSVTDSDGTPRWVAYCAALVFVLGGGALIVGFALAGGAGPDGDSPADTPLWIYLTQQLLGLGIVGSMGAISSWVSFGSGPRAFTTTSSFSGARPASEVVGRIAFGFGAVLIWLFLIALAVRAALRIFKSANP